MSRPPRPNASANGAATAASRIATSTMSSAIETVSCAAAVMMKIASTTPWNTGPSGIGRSQWVAVRSTRSRTTPASTTPISTSASAASTFGRNSTPSLSDWLRNWRPSSDSAANTTTTVSEIRRATASTCDSERPSPARSRTSATPQRSEVLSSPAMRRPRRSSRASTRASSTPMTSSSSAPPTRGRKPPSWSPAWSRIVATIIGRGPRGARRARTGCSRRRRPRASRRCAAASRSRAGAARGARRSRRTWGRAAAGRRRAGRAARPGGARPRRTGAGCRRSFGELPVVGVRGQHLDEVAPRAEQARLHGPERRLGDPRDLLVAQALDVAQHEHDAVLGRQPAKLALEPRDALAALQALGGQARDLPLGPRGLLAGVLDGLGAPPRQVVDRRVVRDLQQPRAERRVRAEALEAVERAQERVLADVLGVLAAGDPARDAEHDVAVSLDERLERAQVAPQGRLDVGVVALGGRARGYVAGHVDPLPSPRAAPNA